jgi:hypothetical protein
MKGFVGVTDDKEMAYGKGRKETGYSGYMEAFLIGIGWVLCGKYESILDGKLRKHGIDVLSNK